MSERDGLPFREIWAVDFEFHGAPGERPTVVCMAALELRTGRCIRYWQDKLYKLSVPPFSIDESALYIAFFASAEFSCHLALGWPLPAYVFDCFTEFRNLTNGRRHKLGNGLLAALTAYGLDAIAADEKHDMRDLVLSGGPWSNSERQAILDYCESDVVALDKLFPRLLSDVMQGPEPSQRLGQALLRGRYMKAVAHMEYTGVPLDAETLARLRNGWTGIQDKLIADIDKDYGVFDGRTFKRDRFTQWLIENRIAWPTTETGQLALDTDTFRQMARGNPEVAPLRELRHSLSEMRLNDLAVGSDGRNRTLLSPFGARSGRNTPSNSRFIFGPSAWLRGLIKPTKGYGLAYVDFSSQEVAVAAALSGDVALMEAYTSGDVYLSFAKRAGLAPDYATKETHKKVRNQCKAVVLGVQYGMGAYTLAQRIGQPEIYARRLLETHQRTYPQFWEWSEGAVDKAMLSGVLETVFGWTVYVSRRANPRSLQNFPCQANGAEMLRLACCMATEAGLKLCAPIHDAVLLEAPLERLNEDITKLRVIMGEASKIVLNGFEVRTDVEVVRWPDRYMDERGAVMWKRVMRLLDELDRERGNPTYPTDKDPGGENGNLSNPTEQPIISDGVTCHIRQPVSNIF